MLTRERAADIFDKLRKYTDADEIELLISGGRSALTRFANNTIHQNMCRRGVIRFRCGFPPVAEPRALLQTSRMTRACGA